MDTVQAFPPDLPGQIQASFPMGRDTERTLNQQSQKAKYSGCLDPGPWAVGPGLIPPPGTE